MFQKPDLENCEAYLAALFFTRKYPHLSEDAIRLVTLKMESLKSSSELFNLGSKLSIKNAKTYSIISDELQKKVKCMLGIDVNLSLIHI